MRVFCDSEEAAQWVGKARQEIFRLKQRMAVQGLQQGVFSLQLSPTAYCSGSVDVSGIESVTITTTPTSVPVGVVVDISEVSPDVAYFEFVTSAYPIVQYTVTQDTATFPAYKACVVGVTIRTDGSITSTILGQKRSFDGSDVSKIRRVFQANLISEPVAYPVIKQGKAARYPRAVFESWAPGNPHTGVSLRDSEYTWWKPPTLPSGIESAARDTFFPGVYTTYIARDVNYDVPFADNTNRSPVRRAYVRGVADWPRAAGIQMVESTAFGKREFAIYVDAFNQFFAFPTGSIESQDGINQNVPDAVVKRVAPTFPAWCYVPVTKLKNYVGADGLVDFPELDWKLNHLGTKAASVVYERSEFVYDTFFNVAAHPTPPVVTPFTESDFATLKESFGVQTRWAETPSGYNPTRYFAAPGIVEATITIDITGGNPEDFSFNVVLSEIRRPSTATYCPVLVGYVWHDIPGVATAGDFVSLDVERWSLAAASTFEFSDFTDANGKAEVRGVLSVKTLPNNVEILSLIDSAPLLAADLMTLSFVQRVQASRAFKVVAHAGESVITADDFGVAITHRGALVEVMTPETALPGMAFDLEAQAVITGRGEVNRLRAIDARFTMVPLTPADGDGWTDAKLVRYRTVRSMVNQYIPWDGVTDVDPGDDQWLKTFNDVNLRWYGYVERIGNVDYILFADNPRWGWLTYQSEIAQVLWLNPYTTFYAHPNGTYCFWDNSWVYQPKGYDPSLAHFNAADVEHVIFDRVFIKTTGMHKSTTFRDLYNVAVAKGKAANTLEIGIDAIRPAHLRAAFEKDTAADIGRGLTYLDLKATWDASTWWFANGRICTPVSGGLGFAYHAGWVGLNFYQAWRSGPAFSGSHDVPGPTVPHVRFANPMLMGV